MKPRRHWFVDHQCNEQPRTNRTGNYFFRRCAMCGEPFDHLSHLGEYIDEQKTPLSLEEPYTKCHTQRKKLTTHYEVRFRLYHYNSGRMDNGWEREIKEFSTDEEALIFAEKVKAAIADPCDKGGQIVEHLGYYGGFIEEFLGVYKVETEETRL